MPHQAAAKTLRPQLTEEELAEGFAQLVSDQWRLADARAFLQRVKAIPSLSAPFLVGHLANGGPKEREVAMVLLNSLAGPRVIVPLKEVLHGRETPDEARMAAALVLQGMGERVDLPGMVSGLCDPQGMFDSIWGTVLDRAETEESFLEGLLSSMQDEPAEVREEMVRSLAEPGDPRALRLLRPLLYAKHTGTVVAAIEAIETVRGTGAIDALKQLAEHDPSPAVKKRARMAYGRLCMMSNTPLPGFGLPPPPVMRIAPEKPALPLHGAWVTLIDGRGDQEVLVVRRRQDGSYKVLSLVISDTQGIKQVLGTENMSASELEAIDAGLRAEGHFHVEMELEACRATVEDARRLMLRMHRRPPMAFEIWHGMLAGPSGVGAVAKGEKGNAEERLRPAISDTELLALIPETGHLLTLPEFRQWRFDAGVLEPYVDEWQRAPFEQQVGAEGEATLRLVVKAAAEELFKGQARAQWSARLRRQASLLWRIGKPEIARPTAAAALGLDPVAGVPLDMHPFVTQMVLHSLYAAGVRTPQPSLPGMGL